MDEILEKLRREADKFVFYQLKHKTKSNTRKIIDELYSKQCVDFKIVKGKVSNRKQKTNESVEMNMPQISRNYSKSIYP